MNKTEARLLDYLQTHERYGATAVRGHGPEGGKVRGGQREYNAAQSLIKKGLAIEIARHRSRDTRRGYSVVVAELTIGRLNRNPDSE